MKKISKEEKALIKAYINLQAYGCRLFLDDAGYFENQITRFIGNRDGEYRQTVEDFIIELINKINEA